MNRFTKRLTESDGDIYIKRLDDGTVMPCLKDGTNLCNVVSADLMQSCNDPAQMVITVNVVGWLDGDNR